MAVVFISPKKKQKSFLMAAAVTVGILVGIVMLWAFLFSGPSKNDVVVTFNKPKITVNFSSLDNPAFETLENFEKIPLQFLYNALNSRGQTVQGVVSANSEPEARAIVEGLGLKVGQIRLVFSGRDNPFIPY